MSNQPPVVVIAGASGHIDKEMISNLLELSFNEDHGINTVNLNYASPW